MMHHRRQQRGQGLAETGLRGKKEKLKPERCGDASRNAQRANDERPPPDHLVFETGISPSSRSSELSPSLVGCLILDAVSLLHASGLHRGSIPMKQN